MRLVVSVNLSSLVLRLFPQDVPGHAARNISVTPSFLRALRFIT